MGSHEQIGESLKWAWLTIVSVAVVDSIWAWRLDFHIDGIVQAALLISVLLAIGLFYSNTGRNPRLSDLGHYMALWLVFPVTLNVYSYLAATMRFPLCDAQLSMLDASLGFHWREWFSLISAHRIARIFLLLAYDSIFLQGFASVAFFALTRNTKRNRELLWIAMLAGIATVAISGFAPALGPMTTGHLPKWTTELLRIRDGSLTGTALWKMEGIVAFPSFHTVLAVVFIYVHRPPCKTFIPIAAINTMMLFSIPFMGHHYVTDMIAGIAITIVAAIAYRVATAPARERSRTIIAAQPAMTMQSLERQ